MSTAMDPTYVIRLNREYEKAMQLNRAANGLIQVQPFPGTTPPYTKYLVTYNFPTLVKAGSSIFRQNSTKVEITLRGPGNPLIAHIPAGDPIPYHTNWWASGMICNGVEGRQELLELIDYIKFVFEVLQFNPSRINPSSVANSDAVNYWHANKTNPSVFPTDTHPFPNLNAQQTAAKLTIKNVKVTRSTPR